MLEQVLTKICESKPIQNVTKMLYVLLVLFMVQIVCLTALVYKTFSVSS